MILNNPTALTAFQHPPAFSKFPRYLSWSVIGCEHPGGQHCSSNRRICKHIPKIQKVDSRMIQDQTCGKRKTKLRLCVQWNVLRSFNLPNGFSQIEHVTCLRISKLLLKEMPTDNSLLCDNKHHHITTIIHTSYSKNHSAAQNASIKDAPLRANRSFYTKHHRTLHGREETFFSILFEDPLTAGLTTTLDYFEWTSYQHFGQILTKHFAVASFRDSFSATRHQLSS